MPNIKFYIDTTKTNKQGYVSIKANIPIGKVNNWKIVGKVKPRYWNKLKQRVSPPRPNEKDNQSEEVNEELQRLEDNSRAYFKDCALYKVPITADLVKDFLNGIKKDFNQAAMAKPRLSFWDAYELFLKTGELEKAHNTVRNRLTIKNKLKTFETETGYLLTFSSIDLTFYDRLKEWILVTKGHGYNYLSAITDKFKAFMNWSIEREYHNNKTYKKFSAPEKEGSIIHLTFQELQQLINFPFETSKLQKARDFYCFGCLTGLRYTDLYDLTKDNLIDGSVTTTTKKTNKEVSIPMFPGLQTIIDRYPEQYRLLPKLSNQRINDNIKESCKIAKINTPTATKTFERNLVKTEFKPKYELIGSHTARKTFICLAYERGIDIEMIKAITGITREKTLRRYLKISDESKKEKLMKAFEAL
ncbi:MAG: site-specific integrase [Mariniphaga sp.]